MSQSHSFKYGNGVDDDGYDDDICVNGVVGIDVVIVVVVLYESENAQFGTKTKMGSLLTVTRTAHPSFCTQRGARNQCQNGRIELVRNQLLNSQIVQK